MCRSCVRGDMEEAGVTYVAITDEMQSLARLIEEFYQLPKCSTGGPLHITTDDNNVDDSNLEFCRKQIDKDENDPWYGDETAEDKRRRRALGTEILDRLAALSIVERAVVCAMHHGDRWAWPGTVPDFSHPERAVLNPDYSFTETGWP